ncbi:MAG: DUF2231 domain-containing protein [Terriglobales bacterium]
MPLHPALVHMPLALAFIAPFLALGFTWALWKGRIHSRAWIIIAALQAVLLLSGLIAMYFGEREEARLKSRVSPALLEQHDDLADQFLWVAGFTLGAASLVPLLRRPRTVRALAVTTLAGSLLSAGAAFRAGHTGGELVYLHNAAAPYLTVNKMSAEVNNDPHDEPVDSGVLAKSAK